ncbi:hypothetical protein B7463_g6714, partial [Scytalidium lignicola]
MLLQSRRRQEAENMSVIDNNLAMSIPSRTSTSISTNLGTRYQNIAAFPLTSSHPHNHALSQPSSKLFEKDIYLLELKRSPQKLRWKEILCRFSEKWPDKKWTAAQLQMRWMRLKEGNRNYPITATSIGGELPSSSHQSQESLHAPSSHNSQHQVRPSCSSPSSQTASPFTPPDASDLAKKSRPPFSHNSTDATSVGPPITPTPPMHELRFNSLSKTYNEYVPLELGTFAKCKEYGPGNQLGIMYFGNHPIQWVSILGNISSIESIFLSNVVTITDASRTTLKCAWSFPAGSTQAISDYLKSTSPLLAFQDRYQCYSPLDTLRVEMDILATGRLGRYRGQICLHIHYIHHLTPSDVDSFQCRAAEYKQKILDHSWVLASKDKVNALITYEETLIRILKDPAATEIVDSNSDSYPAIDWQCPDQLCFEFNHSYSRKCVRYAKDSRAMPNPSFVAGFTLTTVLKFTILPRSARDIATTVQLLLISGNHNT